MHAVTLNNSAMETRPIVRMRNIWFGNYLHKKQCFVKSVKSCCIGNQSIFKQCGCRLNSVCQSRGGVGNCRSTTIKNSFILYPVRSASENPPSQRSLRGVWNIAFCSKVIFFYICLRGNQYLHGKSGYILRGKTSSPSRGILFSMI